MNELWASEGLISVSFWVTGEEGGECSSLAPLVGRSMCNMDCKAGRLLLTGLGGQKTEEIEVPKVQ